MSPAGGGNHMAAASTMTGSVLGLGAIGYFLDYKLGWHHQYGVLAGTLLGLAVGLYEIYKSIYTKDDEE